MAWRSAGIVEELVFRYATGFMEAIGKPLSVVSPGNYRRLARGEGGGEGREQGAAVIRVSHSLMNVSHNHGSRLISQRTKSG